MYVLQKYFTNLNALDVWFFFFFLYFFDTLLKSKFKILQDLLFHASLLLDKPFCMCRRATSPLHIK